LQFSMFIPSLKSSKHSKMCKKNYTPYYTYYGYIKQVNTVCVVAVIIYSHVTPQYLRTYYTPDESPCLSTEHIPLTIVQNIMRFLIRLLIQHDTQNDDLSPLFCETTTLTVQWIYLDSYIDVLSEHQ
jgi:hypothetical protein